jgi:hypothetical protein
LWLVERDVLQELPVPRSGDDDTFDVVDSAVAELGLRRGVWMGDARVMIHLVASVIEQAERFLPELVASAMVDGDCGWADVAVLLGIEAEVARARFDPTSATADGRWMLDVA